MKKLILAVSAFLTVSTSAFAQLGSTDKDLVYTPVTPCRVLDTRTTQGGTGAIAADGTKHFKIWGQTSFAAQGGAASNCGLTAGSNVAAVAMNFTVVTPAAGGFITAYPFGVARPTAATVNFQLGDIARGDFSIAKVTQSGTDHLSIFSSSLADVVGDVVGFYSKPVSAGSLQCSVLERIQDIAPALRHFGQTPVCSAGTLALAGGVICAGNGDQTLNAVDPTSTEESFFVSLTNNSLTTKTCRLHTKCCSIPGR